MAGAKRSSIAALVEQAKPLLKFTDDKAYLEDAGVQMIAKLKAPIFVVILMGDGRAGKSYLASRILNLEEAFESSDSCEPVTEGIDCITYPMKGLLESAGIETTPEDEGMHMLMLDCEGGNNAMAAIRTLVNVFGVAIADEVLFVAGGMLSEAAIQNLGGTVAARSLIKLGDGAEAIKQQLVFVVNKNTLNYDSGALEKTLTTPQKDKGRKENRALICESFPHRSFIGVPLMGMPKFEEQVALVQQTVLRDRKPLQMGGVPVSGEFLCKLLALITEQMQTMNEVSFPSMNRCVVLEGFLTPLANMLFTEGFARIPKVDDYEKDFDSKDPRADTLARFDKESNRCLATSGELVEEARKGLEQKLNEAWETQAKLNTVFGQQTKEVKTETREIKLTTNRSKLGGQGLLRDVMVTFNEVVIETRTLNIKKNADVDTSEWKRTDKTFQRLGEPIFQQLPTLPRVEGTLGKKSPSMMASLFTFGKGKYQERMCVVKEGHLVWWNKDKSEKDGQTAGVISFFTNRAKCGVDETDEHHFTIGPAGEFWDDTSTFTTGGKEQSNRVFTFSTEGFGIARDKWVKAIRANMEFGDQVCETIGIKRVNMEIKHGTPSTKAATAAGVDG